jgi:hypothetical protein
LRNPLAVLCSIINTWVKAKWSKIKNLKYDLISGSFHYNLAEAFMQSAADDKTSIGPIFYF